MKTLKMLSLEEVQKRASKTQNGSKTLFYTVNGPEPYPIVGEYHATDCVYIVQWSLTGQPAGGFGRHAALVIDPPLADWSEFPADTLVRVTRSRVRNNKLWFLDGTGRVFSHRRSSQTTNLTDPILEDDIVELVKGRKEPWFGGPQPVPDNVEVTVWYRGISITETKAASKVAWDHKPLMVGGEVVAVQLTGNIL